MFTSFVVAGTALLAMFQALPTTLAFPTSNTPDGITDFNSTMPAELLLEARRVNNRDIDRVDCDNQDPVEKKWRLAKTRDIKNGINHLNDVSGRPKNGPGPGNCGRVSCSWKAAIYWCNESKKEKELESYQEIAWAAEQLIDKCPLKWANGNDGTPANVNNNAQLQYVKGQLFMKDGWSVLVRYDDDNC
ncbi:hypothetical protein B0T20DRAFT_397401 [Sordaria brevicollis]|uniref:Secreted protein n=1 Tax=Sordaria brevicollis TaxID=83679 RepID=A0AAE0NWZ3_SORBR|nr:hypothetical protein B0T20DRAFT_397401 [Sordaria brevicollis]